MINKKQKLQLLKQAVIHLKNQLTEINDHPNQQPSQKKIGENTLKTKELRHADTQRTVSNKKQSYLKMNSSPKKQNRTNIQIQSKEQLTHHLSNIKSIMESVDNQYYHSKSTMDQFKNQRKSISRTKIPQKECLVKLTSFTDRKYYQSVQSEISEKENEQTQKETNIKSKNNLLLQQRNRVKIFSLPFADHILWPWQEKVAGKKIVKKVEKSPSGFFVNNPNCNDNLKFLGNVGIVSLSKGRIASNRNRSLIFQRIAPMQQSRSCSKRHFGRYFQEQYRHCI